MLGTLTTALYFVVKALRELGNSLFQEEPLPYLVHQPLPWQVQCVTQSRRASRDVWKGGSPRHNSTCGISGRRGDTSPVAGSKREELGDPPKQAAVTIQTCKQKCHQHLRHEN